MVNLRNDDKNKLVCFVLCYIFDCKGGGAGIENIAPDNLVRLG